MSDGDSKDVKGIVVEGMGTKHAIVYKEMGQVENTGYFLNGGDKQALFYPGDAFYEPGKPVDVLALPVAGPWMKISEAIDYVLAVRPRVAFPVHDGPHAAWGIFAQWFMPTFLPKNGIEFVTIPIGETKEF